MLVNELIEKLAGEPGSVQFNDVISVIDEHYHFTPARFNNGNLVNEAGQNNGSCKIFAFALLNKLTVQQTLACFGDYYRVDVLQNPDQDDHQNIRNFIRHGWSGIRFESPPLARKNNR